MEIDFDPAKDSANIRKHRLSLAIARDADWCEAIHYPDNRFDYGEVRMCALIPVENRLCHIAYTETGEDSIRVISVRYAEKTEVAYYVQHYR